MDQYSYKGKDKNVHLFNQGGDKLIKKSLNLNYLTLIWQTLCSSLLIFRSLYYYKIR